MNEATTSMSQAMDEIRHLAATKIHHLAPHMCGTSSLTPAQIAPILATLRKAPFREEALVRPVSRETHQPPESPATNLPPRLADFKNVPDGYYATPPKPGSDAIDYWLVTHETKGKWEGWGFVRRVLGGLSTDSRKLRSVKLENMQQRLAFQAIMEYGLDESQALFADTLERCMDCSSPLTDPVSRAERRGSRCRNKRRS